MTNPTERLNLLIGLRRYADAERAAAHALGRDPGWAAGYTHLARVLIPQNRADEAVEAAREGVRRAPNDAWAVGTLACTLNWFGRYKDAVAPARRAVQLDPTYGWGYAVLANVLYNLGRFKDARRAAVDGLRHDPHGESLHRWKGWAELALRRDPEALATAEAGVRLHPNSHLLLNLLGQVRCSLAGKARFGRRLRLHRAADEALAAAVRLDPSQPSYLASWRDNAVAARGHLLAWLLPPLVAVVALVPAAVFTLATPSLAGHPQHLLPLALAAVAVVMAQLMEPAPGTALAAPLGRFRPPTVPLDRCDRQWAAAEMAGFLGVLLSPFAAMAWVLVS